MPLITAVVPTYNMERYLPAFLNSLTKQDIDLGRVEIIFVSDGSTDGSEELIEAWIAEHGPQARLLRKQNGGLSSARNAGLESAKGTWVTFPDPDDVLAPGYFSAMERVLSSGRADRIDLAASRLIYLDDVTGELRDNHPLRKRFLNGDQIVDMRRHPHHFHLSGGTGFYRTQRLLDHNLRFDPVVRPGFEDAFLTGQYLAKSTRPILANVASAEYHYRRRFDKSSATQSSWHSKEKYTHLLRNGHLRLLSETSATTGSVPQWMQNMVLYDLFFYFREDSRAQSVTAWIDPETASEFRDLVEQILVFIDVDSIVDFNVTNTSWDIKTALLMGGKHLNTVPNRVACVARDSTHDLFQMRYDFAGPQPRESARGRGHSIELLFPKTRKVEYLGTTWFNRRTFWLPADGLVSVKLDGKPVPLTLGEPKPTYKLLPSRTKNFGRRAAKTKAKAQRAARTQNRKDRETRLTLALAKTLRRLFRDAWVLVDRDTQAQDNAEHLYFYLKNNRPDVNAWFVIGKDSTDWNRLQKLGARLVPFGSRRHRALLLNASHLISSQVDHYITNPWDRKELGDYPWKYTFLQHGVTKDDLSRWINGKRIDLMITAAPVEQESIAGDGNNYKFSEKEIKYTGFPRHDTLLRINESLPASERNTVLIMPTWRRYLLGDQIGDSNLRHLLEGFEESDFAVNWKRLISNQRLLEAVQAQGLQLAFMPHPNLEHYIDRSWLPHGAELLTYKTTSVQLAIARAKLMITDYSSLAFEQGFLNKNVLYFQFDAEQFFSGGHAYRKGYWDYEKDGFGPVAYDAESAVDAAISLIGPENPLDEMYGKRRTAFFPRRDDQSSARVTAAIEALNQKMPYEDRYRRTERA